MTTELAMAALIVVLGLFQIAWGAAAYRRVHGLVYANTARDAPPPQPDPPILGRLTRAENNLLATGPYFIAICLIITAAGLSSEVTRVAAMAFVVLRILYLPLYALGVPNLRGMVWTISFIALAVMTGVVVAAIPWAQVLKV